MSGTAPAVKPMNLQWAKASATKSRAAGFAGEALGAFLRQDQCDGVEQDRRSAIDHVIGRDQAAVGSLDAADLRAR